MRITNTKELWDLFKGKNYDDETIDWSERLLKLALEAGLEVHNQEDAPDKFKLKIKDSYVFNFYCDPFAPKFNVVFSAHHAERSKNDSYEGFYINKNIKTAQDLKTAVSEALKIISEF